MQKEAIEKQNSKKISAYKNINQRTINLLKKGYLKEIKSDLINMHGRRDYKVTMKGIYQLIFRIMLNPNDVKSVVDYMDKIKLDKMPFETFLFNMHNFMWLTLDAYKQYTNADIEPRFNKDGHLIAMRHGSYALKRPSSK